MNKFDFKKEHKKFYSASSGKIEIVEVPPFSFLMIDGKGNPNTSADFNSAVEALYSLSYTMKFMIKKADANKDYIVPPLEGLWWMGNNEYFDADNKDEWKWTLLIAQPEFANNNIVDEAKQEVNRKKGLDTSKVRFEKYNEGSSIQTLYVGPYSEEHTTILKLHQFMEENSFSYSGKHHEIYLSDPRKTAPEKLKTIIRQPVRKL